MSEEEKQAKKEYQRKYYQKLKAYEGELLLEKAKTGSLLQKISAKIEIEKFL